MEDGDGILVECRSHDELTGDGKLNSLNCVMCDAMSRARGVARWSQIRTKSRLRYIQKQTPHKTASRSTLSQMGA